MLWNSKCELGYIFSWESDTYFKREKINASHVIDIINLNVVNWHCVCKAAAYKQMMARTMICFIFVWPDESSQCLHSSMQS